MHWQLIAGIDWFLKPENWPIILEVALGIGLVIFVHELGHFAVAKACGVKCEKFYLGFDIGGWKLFKYKWGETEYGIGVLPLGGYVKMLGQDDNPNRLHEETERAKLKNESGEPVEGDALFDPRSYLAKSVPQRMAIISAGVIMNVIFCFVACMIVFAMGVEQMACVVGKTVPGRPAERAGLREGDRILQMGDEKDIIYRDIQIGIPLADNIQEGVKFVIERPGSSEPITINIFPEKRGLIHQIGIIPAHTRELEKPVYDLPFAPLALAKPDLHAGDVIVAVNGEPVADGVELDRKFQQHPEAVTVTVERADTTSPPNRIPRQVDVLLPAVSMKTFGITMQMGKIDAIRAGSPAEAAGVQPGDVLTQIDGEDVGDPLTLPTRLSKRAGQEIALAVSRSGKSLDMNVQLAEDGFNDTLVVQNAPIAAPVLGVAYFVENVVADVEPDSPAARAGIKQGDELVTATLVPPDDAVQSNKFGLKKEDFQPEINVKLGEEKSWPELMEVLQKLLPGTRAELTLKGERKVTLEPAPSETWFNPDRNLALSTVTTLQKATTVAADLRLARRETIYYLSTVFRFIRKIGTGQVPISGLGGPVTIAHQAGIEATAGLSKFILFLAMLSANLAVLNFLPIPVLDGGHMVFLAAEGVRGKPVSERVVACFQFAGFFLLASLMVFVLLLDVGLIPRG
ncbi:MAG TPA: site-2 protease family protein [Pirellulales bacterium]|nr:site-2 protease family protein [Pirellulales bacterium]